MSRYYKQASSSHKRILRVTQVKAFKAWHNQYLEKKYRFLEEKKNIWNKEIAIFQGEKFSLLMHSHLFPKEINVSHFIYLILCVYTYN